MKWDGRIRADARAIPIADESVQCVVTSPPYFALRDYSGHPNQIGLEGTLREYLNHIREASWEMWRVLRADGTLWLNLGDSYAGSWGAQSRENPGNQSSSRLEGGATLSARQILAHPATTHAGSIKRTGLRPKNLIGVPWRIAFMLQEDGWYLRADNIWAKRNCMPESVTDRPTRSHEYVFLFAKSENYFYDHAAIREPSKYAGPNGKERSPHAQGFGRRTKEEEKQRQDKQRGHSRRHNGFNERWDSMSVEEQCSLGRNKRDVWHIGTHPYLEAHYATFPEEIPEICIKAGTKPGDIVLDPFFGSGTVGRVAERLGRRWIGIDLGYQDLQAKRVSNVQKGNYIHDSLKR